MKGPGTKETAEAILRELPSVVGAFVREDVNGHPREIHLLIRPGPEPRHLARDIRSLLEERLGVPVDQRIISIAQLAREAGPDAEPGTEAEADEEVTDGEGMAEGRRIQFLRCDSHVTNGRVFVTVELRDGDARFTGEANELEAGSGRLRAAAAAALTAATTACAGRARFALDHASPITAAGREYALVTSTVAAPALGRRALPLAGAQELDEEPETAAVLAALKSVNRVLGLLRPDAEAGPLPGRLRRR